jgi:hypothetical protein
MAFGSFCVVGGPRSRALAQRRFRGVFLHDPEAGKPKNPDDPFHDNKVQERVAEVIARATRSPAGETTSD